MKTAAYIPGSAFTIAKEAGRLSEDDVVERRKWGRGSQVCVVADEPLADWFESEAGFWAGGGVDRESRWRVNPCRSAAANIRKALKC